MILFLYALGAITVILGLIMGSFSGSFLGFIGCLIGSLFASVIYFVLAKILENQDAIMYSLNLIKQDTEKPLTTLTCPRCEKNYTDDYSSCPHCGHRVSP